MEREEFDLPEPEHIATVVDGIADTVGGTEGLALTHSQHYLQGVMYANGMISTTHYHGSEGVVDSIKAGLKKAWDYLVNMVKKVFGYLFGSKKKEEQIKDIEKDLTKLDESVKIKPATDKKEAQQQLSQIAKATSKMSHAPAVKASPSDAKAVEASVEKVKELQTELAKAETPQEVKTVTEQAVKEYHKSADKAIEVTTNEEQRASSRAIKKLKEAVESMKAIDGTGEGDLVFKMGGLIQSTEKFMNAIKPWWGEIMHFDTLSQAPGYISKTRGLMTAIKHSLVDFEESKKYFDKKLDMFNKKIESDQTSEQEREALKKALKAAGVGITGVAQVSKSINLFLTQTEEFINYFTLELEKTK